MRSSDSSTSAGWIPSEGEIFFYPGAPYNKRIYHRVSSLTFYRSKMNCLYLACVLATLCLTSVAAQGCNVTCYIDNDSDGQGNCTTLVTNQCSCATLSPGKWVDNCLDCNDADSTKLNISCYQDNDRDNYGNTTVSITICSSNPFQCYNIPPARSWAGLPNDCNDHDPRIIGPQFVCCKDEDCDGVGAGPAETSCQACNLLPYSASRVCYDCNDHDPSYISDVCCKNSGNGMGLADTAQFACGGCSGLSGYVSNCQACNASGVSTVSCCIDSVGNGKGSYVSSVQSCHQCANIHPGTWIQDCSDHRNCSEYTPPTTAASPVHSDAYRLYSLTVGLMITYGCLAAYVSV